MVRPKNTGGKRGNRVASRTGGGGRTMARTAEALDALMEFEQFQDEILPMIRKDLANGLSHQDMEKKYLALAAARKITIALREPDSAKALAAIKDMQDRADGKATETKKVEHKFQNMPEEELDAVLKSELSELAEDTFNN